MLLVYDATAYNLPPVDSTDSAQDCILPCKTSGKKMLQEDFTKD